MAWKIERWLSEVFPGESEIVEEYRALSARELAIVAAGVLDVALAELLTLRLLPFEREAEDFLGVNGDGRAPAGSFGSRIQLGLLVGLLTEEDAAILRTIKEIRNVFAHRVRVNFLSPPAQKATKKLHRLWVKRTEGLIAAGVMQGDTKELSDLAKHLPSVSQAGEGLLLAVFTTYHAYFHRMQPRVERIDVALRKNRNEAIGILN